MEPDTEDSRIILECKRDPDDPKILSCRIMSKQQERQNEKIPIARDRIVIVNQTDDEEEDYNVPSQDDIPEEDDEDEGNEDPRG